MSYRPQYFKLHELVPANVIKDLGSELAWVTMDDRILMGADWLRDRFGEMVINGKFGGITFTESGLRDPMTGTGSRYSQHKFGRGLDNKFKKVSVKEVYAYLIANQPEARAHGITRIENITHTPTWIHIDCGALPKSYPDNGIQVVTPRK